MYLAVTTSVDKPKVSKMASELLNSGMQCDEMHPVSRWYMFSNRTDT